MKVDIMKGLRRYKGGFSLVETLVALGILVVVLGGLLQLFIYCSLLSESAKNMTFALSEAQGKVEEIRDHNYAAIAADYAAAGTPGSTFNLTQCTGMGIVRIDSSNADLLQIEVIVSWRNHNNRVIGEDTNLNGTLDTGEDANGNGKLDSVVSLVSLMAKR